MTDEAGRLFREGRLAEATQAAGAEVRRSPASTGARLLLADLLLLGGSLERADAVLAAAEAVDPQAALPVAEFRQLLRAATARQQVLREGRLPEFLGEPTAAQRLSLEALIALRNGDGAAAAVAVHEAEAARPAVAGEVDGSSFEDLRDADDLWGGNFEVLTMTGKYFWIPIERVESVAFQSPKRPRDLAWRRCTMTVRGGPDGDVFVPALYDAEGEQADTLRLGRETLWSEAEPVRGAGQRIFLVGDEGLSVQQLGTVEFR